MRIHCIAVAAMIAANLSLVVTTGATAFAATSSPSPSPSPAAAPGVILVPGGTPVVVALTEPISSGTANVDDQIGLVVKKEVDVGGWVVIPAGASGHATITSVQRAGGNGSGGKLAMTIDWVYSADGGRVQLSQTNHNSENGDKKGAASTATLLSWALLGPLGFFAHNFVRGKDVTIGTDKTFTVFVDHDVHVDATQKVGETQGFDH
jgi:hypothetical protein